MYPRLFSLQVSGPVCFDFFPFRSFLYQNRATPVRRNLQRRFRLKFDASPVSYVGTGLQLCSRWLILNNNRLTVGICEGFVFGLQASVPTDRGHEF